jgi:hypothetical protein
VDLIQQLKANYRRAPISSKEVAMLEYAELLTVQAANTTEEDIERLREAGWTDEDILHIAHVTAFFNYVTRLADGLGVDLHGYQLLSEERDLPVVDTRAWGSQGSASPGRRQAEEGRPPGPRSR